MFKQLKHVAAVLAVAAPTLVCAQQPAATATDGEVAARVGNRVITMKEVDEAWRSADPVEHTRATQLMYDGRKDTLDRMIADMLIAEAAKAKGVSAEQLATDEMARRVKPVTDADVASFYEQNKGRMQGKPLEEMTPMVRTFLVQQHEAAARDAFVGELRKAGPAIRVALDPPRQKVDVAATDPSRGATSAGVVVVEYSDYQ